MQSNIQPYDILFIEDEKAIRANYVKYLQRHFRNAYEAEDGEEAYKLYKQKRPDILIVDINIPKLSGIELLKKNTRRRSQHKSLDAHIQHRYGTVT